MRSSYLAAAIALAVFYLRSAPGVTFEDAGELAAAATSFGVAHPPGYPLLTLVGGLCIRLGELVGVAPARCMVLLSVFSSAVAVGLVARVVEIVRPQMRSAALVAGLLLILSPTFAAQAVVVEAYGPAAALQAGLLLAALVARPLIVGVVFGLALAAHPGSLFLAPLFVFGILRTQEKRTAWLRGITGLTLGLSTFLYVPLAAARAGSGTNILNWGGIHDAGSLVSHLLREQFGAGPERDLIAQAEFASEHLIGQWPVLLAVILLLGVRWRKREEQPRTLADIAALLFGATLFVTSIGLFWAQHWPVEEQIARIRLAGSFTPVIVVCAALVGVLLGHLEERWGARPAPLFVLLCLSLGLFHVSPYGEPTLAAFQDMSHVSEAQTYADTVLEGAPPDAILVVNRLGYSDVLYFPLLYAQVALGTRTDVLVIDRELLGADWYRAQLAAQRPVLSAPLQRLELQLVAAAKSGPRQRRLASIPFLQELASSAQLTPNGLGFIGKPGPAIQGELSLTPGPNGWWLGRAPKMGAAQATELSWTFLPKDPKDPWRRELLKLSTARTLN